MKVIGITGPTGAGKTTVLQQAAALGGLALDCDQLYHTLLEHSAPLQAALTARFGTYDRKEIAAQVFQTPAALLELNKLTHRFVIDEIERRLSAAEREGSPFAAIDAIALVESGLAARCDAVIAVLSPHDTRLGRIVLRDGIAQSHAARRAAAQQSDAFYREHSSHVLSNDGTREQFAQAARELLARLVAEGE